MARMPIISGEKAIRAFAKIGYREVRRKGSHIRLNHPAKKPLTIPDHKILGKGLLRKLIRDSELSLAEFSDLLKS